MPKITKNFLKWSAAPAVLLVLLPSLSYAQAVEITYDAQTKEFIKTDAYAHGTIVPVKSSDFPKLPPGTHIHVTVVNPNSFQEQYEITFPGTDVHVTVAPTALQNLFVPSSTRSVNELVSGFKDLSTPPAGVFVALSKPSGAALGEIGIKDGQATYPVAEALFTRFRIDYVYAVGAMAAVQYFAPAQNLDREVFTDMAGQKNNNDIRTAVAKHIETFYKPQVEKYNPANNLLVKTKNDWGETQSILEPYGFKNYLLTDTSSPATAVSRAEDLLSLSKHSPDDLRQVAALMPQTLDDAERTLVLAMRDMHLCENQLRTLWIESALNGSSNTVPDANSFAKFDTDYINPLDQHVSTTADAFHRYLETFRPRLQIASALCVRGVSQDLFPDKVPADYVVPTTVDIQQVAVKVTTNLENIRILTAFSEQKPGDAQVAAAVDVAQKPQLGENAADPAPQTDALTLTVYKRNVVDFSTGIIASGLQDEVSGRPSRGEAKGVALAHVYPTGLLGGKPFDSLALSLGVPLTGNSDLDHFLVGGSLVLGQKSRVFLTVGQEYGKVQRQIGDSKESRWDNGWFAGLTFALNLPGNTH